MPDQPQQNPNIQPPYYFEEDTISLMDILLFMARQIKVIFIIPFLTCFITIIYVLFYTSPVYESTAKIMSSSGGSSAAQATGLARQFGINISTGESEPKWVYPEIIKSRTLARKLLKRKFDTEKYGLQKPLLQILTYGNNQPPASIDILTKIGADMVTNMIDISKEGSLYIIKVNSFEPNFSRDFVNAIIKELEGHQKEYNTAKIGKARRFIEERIYETEMELNTAEEALKDFRDRNRRIENSPTLQLEQQRFTREVSVITGVFTTLKQQLETTKIEEVKESDYVIVLDPPEAPLRKSGPNRRIMVILSGFIGISLGLILAFIKDFIEKDNSNDIEKLDELKSLLLKNITDMIFPLRRKN